MITLPTTTSSTDRPSRGDLVYAEARYQSEAHGFLVRAVRTSGMSQKELAARAGVDEATVSRVLSRPRNIEANTLSRLVYAACGAFLTVSFLRPPEGRRLIVRLAKGADQKASSTDKMFRYWKADWSSAPNLVPASSSVKPTEEPVSLDTGEYRIVEMARA